MSLYIGNAGINKIIKQPYIGDSGINKIADEVFIGNNGINQKCYSSGEYLTYIDYSGVIPYTKRIMNNVNIGYIDANGVLCSVTFEQNLKLPKKVCVFSCQYVGGGSSSTVNSAVTFSAELTTVIADGTKQVFKLTQSGGTEIGSYDIQNGCTYTLTAFNCGDYRVNRTGSDNFIVSGFSYNLSYFFEISEDGGTTWVNYGKTIFCPTSNDIKIKLKADKINEFDLMLGIYGSIKINFTVLEQPTTVYFGKGDTYSRILYSNVKQSGTYTYNSCQLGNYV